MLLEKFPNADSNKDGELTVPEAIAYYQKMLADRKKKPGKKSGPKPTHTNVSYGPDKRNVLDLWLVDSKKPTPLVIYIHGGGFVGGSKNGTSPEIIQQAHKRGISVAAINYRFVFKFPFPAPQHDGARAIQFLRHHAEKYNVDPNLFAAFGGSAGAGISMWLGYHDDLANPKSEDLIERASSRVCAVGSLGGQSTYDPAVIEQWVGGRAHEHPSIYYCYNVKTLEELADPKLQPLYDEVSAIKHLTKDDPPTYMFYNEENKPMRAGARPGEGIHHPIFGIKLQEALNKLNIESEFHNESNAQKILLPTMLDFFENQFAKQK
ncbi:MAG: alpha/beta hydrolase [Planctomycetaceae bacterium]|nr:alpha/beta hydrolase [Planctomycetaceae bacterium]